MLDNSMVRRLRRLRRRTLPVREDLRVMPYNGFVRSSCPKKRHSRRLLVQEERSSRRHDGLLPARFGFRFARGWAGAGSLCGSVRYRVHSGRDLLNVLDEVAKRGGGFRSLKDTWADSTTAHGSLMAG
jgi:hypothetical protein